jgi:hypothetical protein
MHRFIQVASLAVLVSATTDRLAAQTCLGRPFFSSGYIQIGGGLQIGNNSTVISGEIAVGRDRSFFVQGNVAHETLDVGGGFSDPNGLGFGVAAGYQIPSGRMQLCPFIAARTASLEFSGDVELERSLIQGGLMLGLAKPAGSGFHFVPFGGLAVAQLSSDFEGEETELSFGTDTYFPLTVGLGMHFSRSFALVGDVTIPIDLGSTRPIIGIRAVFPFGGRQ